MSNNISVVIPCYPPDIKSLFEFSIPSFEYSTYPPLEIIISLSETTNADALKIENELKSTYTTNIIVYNTEIKQHAGENRNRGAKIAQGDIIIFFDSDDEIHPQKIEITKKIFDKYSPKMMMHSWLTYSREFVKYNIENLKIIDSQQIFNYTFGKNENPKWLFLYRDSSDTWGGRHDHPHHGHIAIDKKVMNDVEYTDKLLAEDTEFDLKVLKKYNKTIFVDAQLVNYIQIENKEITETDDKWWVPDNPAKIFISIASYCDELLFFTIQDCIAKAKFPENITFAIVDQNSESQKEKIDELGFSKQIKYVYINKLETLGVSWARNVAFSLWDNEKYLLQIDSHMTFENNWDETLIKQHENLLKTSDKPIISTYPYDFEFDENNNPVFKKPSGEYALELRPHPETMLEEESAVLRFRAEHKKSSTPVNGCHMAAGFIFTSANFIEEVPYDPYLYFHGEEQSLSIRAYTRGWDIYHPTSIPLYHHYKKIGNSYTTHHWHKSVDSKRALSYSYLKERAKKRVNRLFYGDGMKNSIYGLGNVRTLDDYIKFSGIDYKNKTIKEIVK